MDHTLLHYIHQELTGDAMSDVYDSLLRDLRYEHIDSAPGNPTAGLRSACFSSVAYTHDPFPSQQDRAINCS